MIVVIMVTLLFLIVVRYIEILLRTSGEKTVYSRIQALSDNYGKNRALNHNLLTMDISSHNLSKMDKDDYCIIGSCQSLNPMVLLSLLLKDQSINYVAWVPKRFHHRIDHRFVENSRDTFVTLMYDEYQESFSDAFLMVQRSKFGISLLYDMCQSSIPIGHYFTHVYPIKILNVTDTVQHTYLFTIYSKNTFSNFFTNPTFGKYRLSNRDGFTYLPTVFQTWVSHWTDNERIFNCYQKTKEIYPNNPYKLFSDFEMKSFIRQNYGQVVCEAYDNMVPFAFKSDFFRYLFLYKNGGIYFDITVKPSIHLLEHIQKTHSSAHAYGFISATDNGVQHGVWNGMMYSLQYHDIPAQCIKRILESATKGGATKKCLEYTGPVLLGKVVRQYVKTNGDKNVLLLDFKDSRYIRDCFSNTVLFFPKNEESDAIVQTKRMNLESKKQHYSLHCMYNRVFLFQSISLDKFDSSNTHT